MRKINWKNVYKAVVLLLLSIVIIRDCYLVIFGSYQWTWLGVFTFILSLYLAVSYGYDLYDQIKSIPSYQPKHAKDTSCK